MTISQDDFHAWSINLLEKVRSYCQRALERVGKRAADIDDVLLVGGSVMMPMIRELVQQLFGREARFDARNVRTLVAQGAALWAYRCELNDPDHPGAGALSGEPQETALAVSTPGVVKQALPRGFGVLVVDRLGEERIETLLAKDTTCPTSITKTFPVVDPRARRVRIGFYEGESDCRIDCVHVGDVVLEVPPQTGAREIKLSLSVDESTRLRIDAIDLQSGVGRELLIENHAQISVDQFEDRRRLLKEFEIVV
jgi:molecular chaperone DnaK